MEDDVSPHKWGDDIFVSRVWHSQQEFFWWGFRGKSQSSQSVHDQVDPKHLNWGQWGFLNEDSTQEGHENGDDVDCKLELQEFSDTIENVSTVFGGCDNTAKVIIK